MTVPLGNNAREAAALGANRSPTTSVARRADGRLDPAKTRQMAPRGHAVHRTWPTMPLKYFGARVHWRGQAVAWAEGDLPDSAPQHQTDNNARAEAPDARRPRTRDQYMLSAHGCGALKFRMFPHAVPGWQYCPGGQGTGRLSSRHGPHNRNAHQPR